MLGWWIGAARGLWHQVAASLAAITLIYAWMVGRRRWTPASVGFDVRWLRAMATGVVWGAGLAGVVLVLTVLGGARVVSGPALAGERYVGGALMVLVGLGAAAMVEELLFRGYPLVRLARAAGPIGASLVLTAAFVGMHVPNPGVTWLGLVNIGLAGLVLSGVFFAGGGLPGAWALHVGWNAGLALAADAPVSGLRFALPAIDYVPGRVAWWDGGSFGPEGGLAATVLLGGAAWYWMHRVWSAAARTEKVTA